MGKMKDSFGHMLSQLTLPPRFLIMENVLDRISKSVGTQLQHPGKVLALTTDAGFSPVEVHARLVPVLPARSGLDNQVMQLLWDTVGDLQAAQRYCNLKKPGQNMVGGKITANPFPQSPHHSLGVFARFGLDSFDSLPQPPWGLEMPISRGYTSKRK